MNLIQLLRQAGFRGEGLRIAYSIAMRESGGNPGAYNGNANTGDKSYGLFQINMLGDMGPARRQQYGLRSNEDLFNPVVNAKVAYRMSKGGTDFGAWGYGPNAYANKSLNLLSLPGGGGPQLAGVMPQGAGGLPDLTQTTPGEVATGNAYTDIVSSMEKLYATQHVLPPMTFSNDSSSGIAQDRISGSFGAFGKLLASQPSRTQGPSVDPLHDILTYVQQKAAQAQEQGAVDVPQLPEPDGGGTFGTGTSTLPPAQLSKWVTLAPGADRQGMHTEGMVLDFVAQVARQYGQKLTIGTGTQHRQYVAGTHRESDHWFGDAADIPMAGRALTRLGQSALIAAGADPKWARKQRGGVFNINGYNILFNTNVGGNHYNHLHVGLGRREGSRRSGGRR